MLGPSHPLRQVGEDVLQELDPARGDRPFEWRRDFQIINFVIAKPEVHLSHELNRLTFFIGNRDGTSPEPLVQAGSGSRLSIRGAVSRLDRGDDFYQTRPSPDAESGLFEAFPAKGVLQVEISACDPLEGDQVFGPGTYPGQLLVWDPELEDDTLTLDLRAPASALRELAESLQSGKAASLALQVCVRAFTYEVDDALREPYHRQSFVVHGRAAYAAILSIRTLSLTLPSTSAHDPEHADLAQPISSDRSGQDPALSTLNAVSTPLWVICGLLLLLVFAR